MSSITPSEIFGLCMEQFGVGPSDYGQSFLNAAGGNRARSEWPAPLRARAVAVYLIRRHTTASWSKTAEATLYAKPSQSWMERQTILIRQLRWTDAEMHDAVEAIERKIDRAHDAYDCQRFNISMGGVAA